MKLWFPRFHLSDALGYRSPTPSRVSVRLPVSTPPNGPVKVALIPTSARPTSPATPTVACAPAMGVLNTYVGIASNRSARTSSPLTIAPPRRNDLPEPASVEEW